MNRSSRTAAIRKLRNFLVDEALQMGAPLPLAERYATFEIRRYSPLKNSILRAILREETLWKTTPTSALPDPLDSLQIVKEENFTANNNPNQGEHET